MSILKGIRVVEMAGLAPAPFCGMILADFGADVIRVDKLNSGFADRLSRGKRSIALNLKRPNGVEIVKKLCNQADVLIEPFRSGVMEKLGLGPKELLKQNPKLIYSRLTGYGQSGCYSQAAGHDINYLAISGVLSRFGRKDENPSPPINLLADFAGGGLMCAFGITLALLERERSGLGQIIDSNMVEGSAYIGSWLWAIQDLLFSEQRGTNTLDTGTHFYETYKTKDGKFMSVGSIEPQFYQALVEGLGVTQEELSQTSPNKKKLADIFATKSREEWTKIFEKKDACVAPILELNEAPLHPHNLERGSFFKSKDGVDLPRPAPVFSRTPGQPKTHMPEVGEHTQEVLREIGYTQKEIDQFFAETVVAKL